MINVDWSKCPAVESVPGKVSGAWVLLGTRMPVSAIFENLDARAMIDDEGISREQINELVKLAADNA